MAATSTPRGIGDIFVSSRPYDEYLAMFGLHDKDVLAGPVLDCPGGAGSFAAGLRSRGGVAVGADPAYAMTRDEIVASSRAGLERGMSYLRDNMASYAWSFFADPDDLRRRRLDALDAFAAHYDGADEHHVAAALPDLPFTDGRFRLALSGYLLFTYPDHLDLADHRAFLRELLRVAREEVRVYPLIDTAYVRYPDLDLLRRELHREGVDSELRAVDYAFQRGADEVLVLRPPPR